MKLWLPKESPEGGSGQLVKRNEGEVFHGEGAKHTRTPEMKVYGALGCPQAA